MTEVAMRSEHLIAVRRQVPGAIGIGWITGLEPQTKAELRRMERAGEVAGQREYARRVAPGVIKIPYVRLRTRADMRRAFWIRTAALVIGALMFLAAVGWLLWQSRYVIGAGFALLAGVALIVRFALHWSHGCPGLHCSGCRG